MDEQQFNIDISEKLLTVSPSPHVKHHDNTRSVMLDVVIALTPALIWAVYIFGFRALTVTLVSIISCVIFEFLYGMIFKKSKTVLDLSAVVTGMLLAFNLPAAVSLWIPIVGSFFAIIIVKQLFGGIGMNIVNPALAARVFLFSWPEQMTTYPEKFSKLPALAMSVNNPDAIASATPLAMLKQGELPSELSVFDMLIGNCAGVIGEISAVLLIAGGIYLLIKKVITWHIPVAYIGTVAVISFIFNSASNSVDFMIYEIISGGLLLGAIFMATDYSTSPVTKNGRLIYGVGCGLLTILIRYFSGYSGGVSFAILIMNLLVWYIDKYTKPKRFGYVKEGK